MGGGLHVIVSEPNESSRIDRQLIGRAARQGDPGSARIFATPKDETFRIGLNLSQLKQLQKSVEKEDTRGLAKWIKLAQARIARDHREQRARLMAVESRTHTQMRTLGLDPYLDPLPDV